MDIENNYTNKMDDKDAIGNVTGFFLFRNLINNYNKDKSKIEEERKNIKKYGRVSCTLSLIALFLSLSYLISSLINLDFVGFSYILLIVIYILGGFIISLILAIYGFVFGVMQVRLNRKSIGIIGLVLSVLSIISSIALIILLFI